MGESHKSTIQRQYSLDTKEMNMVLVTSYFNPGGNKYQLDNYNKFVDKLGAVGKEKLATIVLHHGDMPKIECGNVIMSLPVEQKSHAMWQKEALLNLAIRKILSLGNVDAIAWLDADIVFHCSPEVMMEKAEWLFSQGFDILQLFNTCQYIGRTNIEHERPGVVASGMNRSACYGMAWAAKREVLEEKGLFDVSITGSGDAYMAEAWFGRVKQRAKIGSKALHKYYETWVPEKKPKVGYLKTGITHLYHGDLKNRRYGYRLYLMRKYKYDPLKDIKRDAAGLLEWTDNNPKLRREVSDWILRSLYK